MALLTDIEEEEIFIASAKGRYGLKRTPTPLLILLAQDWAARFARRDFAQTISTIDIKPMPQIRRDIQTPPSASFRLFVSTIPGGDCFRGSLDSRSPIGSSPLVLFDL